MGKTSVVFENYKIECNQMMFIRYSEQNIPEQRQTLYHQ